MTALNFIKDHWPEFVLGILTLLGAGIVIKKRSNRQSGSSSYTNQSGAHAKGDIVGRDKIVGREDRTH
jgi:hypothetical protein